jgi:hypothetical protein
MTPEKIRKAIDEVFNRTQNKSLERRVNVWRYCLTAENLIEYSAPFNHICSNKECPNCQEIHCLLETEVKAQLKRDFKDEM